MFKYRNLIHIMTHLLIYGKPVISNGRVTIYYIIFAPCGIRTGRQVVSCHQEPTSVELKSRSHGIARVSLMQNMEINADCIHVCCVK